MQICRGKDASYTDTGSNIESIKNQKFLFGVSNRRQAHSGWGTTCRTSAGMEEREAVNMDLSGSSPGSILLHPPEPVSQDSISDIATEADAISTDANPDHSLYHSIGFA